MVGAQNELQIYMHLFFRSLNNATIQIKMIKNNSFVFLRTVFSLATLFFFASQSLAAGVERPVNLMVPPGSETETSITLLWDKPCNYGNITGYNIYKNGYLFATVIKTNFTVKDLLPNTYYSFYIKARYPGGHLSKASNTVKKTTKSKGKIFNILAYGAKDDGITKNTEAIQKAINACSPDGTVYIPRGIFLSGALFLKSNMTLLIAAGGVLKGSTDIKDYYPLIHNRFEGWELNTFASLLTAGTMEKSGPYNVTNLTIRGEGKISGGGLLLGEAMIAAEGMRGRGRLICIMNGQNINIQGLVIENSPCWTIHYIYSNNVTCHDLTISSTVNNGDGIDPDSSTDSYIFNCSFSTEDDCIAIKSGKNPEGFYIAKPTENIRITDCNFIKGHGVSIGSEMSGGVKNVIVRDCEIGNLLYGVQIKGTKERGGIVEKILIKDCNLLKITIITNVSYNKDGAPAPDIPYFRDMEFSNLNMANADTKEDVISINGFSDTKHYTRNILLKNIKLPESSNISVKNCDHVTFDHVLSVSGKEPIYTINNSLNIKIHRIK